MFTPPASTEASERRLDPFTGRSVLLAPNRRGIGGARPKGHPAPRGPCPFCPGNEADTEPTVARWPATGPWRVRVVRNKFPIVTPLVSGARDAPGTSVAAGIHEVGIDAPGHDADLADLSLAQLTAMLRTYRDRIRALEETDGIEAVMFFRNRGVRAGSSQPHPHSQIAALGWVPSDVALRWDIAARFLSDRGESLHAAELRRELADGRILTVDDELASFCPYAPTRPFEVRFAPLEARGGFGTATPAQLESLAAQLRDATRRLRRATPITDYNLVLRQPPVAARGPAASWHLELLPRTGGDAGFELGTGEMIVVVTPEESAARLRATRAH